MSSSIRKAVSVILHRPSTGEVHLVRRNPALRFFGGFWAFAGGALHEVDAQSRVRVRGGKPEAAEFYVAAAREAFEELGISFVTPPLESRARSGVIEDPRRFAELLGDAHRLDADALLPWIRLLTPPFSPIRFDTLFLGVDVDRFPGAANPSIVEGELVEGAWSTPAEWLARWRRGELLIAPPVLLILRILADRPGDAALDALAELEREFAAGEIHPIHYDPAVQLLPLRTPTLPPATHTNAYLVGRAPAYLVDPATPHAGEQERLARAVDAAIRDGSKLEAILLTHHHPDHVGAVEFARARWRLPVWAHRITADLLRGRIPIDRELAAGDRLPMGTAPDGQGDWELECLFTPGHAAGHLCFLERRYGSLLCGDMMSTLSSILVHPDDGDMAQYVDSLRRLSELDGVRVVFPAHGPATAEGSRAIRAQLEHRAARERAIAGALRAGARTLEELVEAVYADVDPAMHGYAALSIRSVLRKLAQEGDSEATRIVA